MKRNRKPLILNVRKERKDHCTKCKRIMNYHRDNRLCWDCDYYTSYNIQKE